MARLIIRHGQRCDHWTWININDKGQLVRIGQPLVLTAGQIELLDHANLLYDIITELDDRVPLAAWNFAAGIGEMSGVSTTFAEMWRPGINWSAHVPARILPNAGYILTGSGVPVEDGLISTPELFGVISQGGLVIVLEYEMTKTAGDVVPYIEFDVVNTSNYSLGGWGWSAYQTEENLYDFGTVIEVVPSPGLGSHKVACAFSPTALSRSVDGGAILVASGNPQDNLSAVEVGLYLAILEGTAGAATVTIKSVVFYPISEAANLQVLST